MNFKVGALAFAAATLAASGVAARAGDSFQNAREGGQQFTQLVNCREPLAPGNGGAGWKGCFIEVEEHLGSRNPESPTFMVPVRCMPGYVQYDEKGWLRFCHVFQQSWRGDDGAYHLFCDYFNLDATGRVETERSTLC